MKLKKCPACNKYTLKPACSKCKQRTKQAGYKFLQYNKDKKSEINELK